jgi:hypothetical protein
MKKFFVFLTFLLFGLKSYSQIIVNQSISAGPYKVGDTITVTYTVDKGVTKPRYFWLRYQFNNKALTYLSTTFSQGSSAQTFYTGWSNYKFTAAANVSDTSLYGQYQATPWGYAVNADWNVGQLAVQRADQSINGVIATQKYILKDQNTYENFHKLDLSYALDSATGANIPFVKTTSNPLTITGVTGNTSYFKVRVLFPSGYDMTKHQAQLLSLKTDGSGEIDWTKQAIASKAFDGSGEALFTTGVKVGDSIAVWIGGATQQAFMNNIVTVSDAYKAFLGISQTDIAGVANYFTRPVLEKKIGFITKDKTTFSESDSYFLLAYVMGQDVSSKASIPTNAAPVNQTVNYKWYNGLLNQKWLDGTPTNRVNITSAQQTAETVFAWGGDLDWSHSSHPDTIAARITSGVFTNSLNQKQTSEIRSMAVSTNTSIAYEPSKVETVSLGITAKLEGGKVVLYTNLTKEGLAGLQVIMQYDNTKLDLDNVVFDSGATMTNFSTKNDSRLTFGSIDQMKTSRIKIGTPYKLIFTPKVALQNTAGLFYYELADAVDGSGKKINLTIE